MRRNKAWESTPLRFERSTLVDWGRGGGQRASKCSQHDHQLLLGLQQPLTEGMFSVKVKRNGRVCSRSWCLCWKKLLAGTCCSREPRGLFAVSSTELLEPHLQRAYRTLGRVLVAVTKRRIVSFLLPSSLRSMVEVLAVLFAALERSKTIIRTRRLEEWTRLLFPLACIICTDCSTRGSNFPVRHHKVSWATQLLTGVNRIHHHHHQLVPLSQVKTTRPSFGHLFHTPSWPYTVSITPWTHNSKHQQRS